MTDPAPPRAGSAIRRFGPLALAAAAFAVAFAMGGPHALLHAIRAHHGEVTAFARAHPVAAPLAYLAVYATAIALSLPIAMFLTITGGALFGPFVGGFCAASGCTLGGTAVFLICRTAAGDVLRRRAGPTIARIEDGVLNNAFSYIMVLRLLPVMPLWLVNVALGFIEIPVRTFMAATFVGILPVSIIYAGLGSGLARVFAEGGRISPHALMRPELFLALGGLATLSLAPIIVRRFRRPRT